MTTGRRRRAVPILGVIVAALIALYFLWSWDWFLPIVESKASASLGRKVTAQHLRVALGSTTRIRLIGIKVPAPAGFPDSTDVADIGTLTVRVKPFAYLQGDGLVIPMIGVDRLRGDIVALADGRTNYDFAFMHPAAGGAPAKAGAGPHLGTIEISNSHVDVALAKLKAKLGLDIHTTQSATDPSADRIIVDARGTYAGQPITGHAAGGALLTLQDRTHPYPLSLAVANGPTRVSLDGSIADPLHFAGADLKLVFSGPDMSLLYPLTGIPIPSTPPYRISGRLGYLKSRITFDDFSGKLGSSDLEGNIAVAPRSTPPDLTATISSHEVNLVDLGGFIGAKPGHAAENRAAHGAPGEAGGTNVLPTTQINLPKLKAMNVDLHYSGRRIEGKFIPLDNVDAWLVIDDGVVRLKKLNFGVGRGTLESHATLSPDGKGVHADADVDLREIDLSHLLNATHAFHGQGIVGGHAALDGTGSSVAGLVGNGNGGVSLYMRDGGDVSALLPDIAGLEFGNAILSALGVPRRTDIQCFVADLPLHDGILSTRLFVLQTGEARTTGSGTIDFRRDLLDYTLTTRSTHFSVGSLPGPIHITGPISKPSILPGAEVLARGAATVGLGIVFAPLAILPTVQFGVGKSAACEEALRDQSSAPAGGQPGEAATTTAAGAADNRAGVAQAGHAHPLSASQIHKVWQKRLHPH